MTGPSVHVVGAGVAGLATAVVLAERGVRVTLHERGERLGAGAASWLAGGMLAPFCEAERAPGVIVGPGLAAIDWWRARVPGVVRGGTLVLAAPRETSEIARFESRTQGGRRLDGPAIAALEPHFAGRFETGLHYGGEAHLDPRLAMTALAERLIRLGGHLRFGSEIDPRVLPGEGVVVDGRGSAASEAGLRPVRGEMLVLHAPEIRLSRPVRFLHPRHPIYVVPRGDGRFMLGATEIESGATRAVTVRSAVELLNAAYALHPGFAEAEIVEFGAGLRPAFPDNLPRVWRTGRVVSVNGLYRHGFLLGPSVAGQAADLALDTLGLASPWAGNPPERTAA